MELLGEVQHLSGAGVDVVIILCAAGIELHLVDHQAVLAVELNLQLGHIALADAGVGQGGGLGRKLSSELAPAVEKERVSNYDPNKKNYERQNDLERTVKSRKQQSSAKGSMAYGMDDEFERGKRGKKKAQIQQPKPEPVKIEKAIMNNETITVKDLSERIGKQPVEVQDSPGFVVNRILVPMMNEAAFVLSEGVASAEDIDRAMQLGANHPMGPLHLADLVGLDVVLYICDVMYSETHDPKFRACYLLRKMVRAGKLGRKSGEGFFKY